MRNVPVCPLATRPTYRCRKRLVCMKTTFPILFLLIVTAGFAAVPTTKPVSDDVLLSAIATVETGNNPYRLGRYGERTRLQIMPETWREYSRLPHSAAASNRAETDRVARAYLKVIRERLKERGLPQTPYYIAACWNAGPSWRHLSSGTVAYAHRVENVVEERLAERAAQAEEASAEAVVAKAAPVPQPLNIRITPAKEESLVAQSQPLPAAEPSILSAPPAPQPGATAQLVASDKPVPVIDLNAPAPQPRATLLALQIGAGAFFHVD